MVKEDYSNEGTHAELEYLKLKQKLPESFTLNVSEFKRGICFVCATPCNDDAFIHLACALSYEDYKKKLLRNWMEKQEAEGRVKIKPLGDIIK